VAVELGWVPQRLVVHLTRGGGFRPGLESTTGPWPDGTEIALVFTPPSGDPPIEWTADIDGAFAMWTVTAAEVEEVIDSGADSVVLHRTAPDMDPDVWGKGYVNVH
jgi:hypothetical protein